MDWIGLNHPERACDSPHVAPHLALRIQNVCFECSEREHNVLPVESGTTNNSFFGTQNAQRDHAEPPTQRVQYIGIGMEHATPQKQWESTRKIHLDHSEWTQRLVDSEWTHKRSEHQNRA
jgi:hypothetical protein